MDVFIVLFVETEYVSFYKVLVTVKDSSTFKVQRDKVLVEGHIIQRFK